jgi:aromatic ring-opening dioxygenase catalytic subunit (LigB family)
LVHNRNEIQKFGGHEIEPDYWAKEFNDFIIHEMSFESTISYTGRAIAAYNHKLFTKSHPTSEHYLPFVFATAFGGNPKQIYQAFQWKNLSMAAFLFD